MRLGKYLLIRRLAVGGMAEIYLALDREGSDRQLVALKRLLPAYVRNREYLAMFMDEARVAASLAHPNTVRVHEVGAFGSDYFFTMEWIDGLNALDLLVTAYRTRRPLPLGHALLIAASAAAGLHHAHERVDADGTPLGIVHRDVSPSNVIVATDGRVKLVDFGIAKVANSRAKTRVGTRKGKASYMSPEQCRGLSVDRRSDVFGLGILLYELTCGRKLFRGASPYQVWDRITRGDFARPAQVCPTYPAPLESIALRALAVRPEDRFATALDFRQALLAFARSHRLTLAPGALGDTVREAMRRPERFLAAGSRGAAPPPVPITADRGDDRSRPVLAPHLRRDLAAEGIRS
jgi:serine/threonine-protein kinase